MNTFQLSVIAKVDHRSERLDNLNVGESMWDPNADGTATSPGPRAREKRQNSHEFI